MSDYKKLVDKRWIAIGKSLPFSIYDSQRKLLLAQGHVVESERSLQRLLEHGQYYKAELSPGPRDVTEEELAADPVDPLTALSRDRPPQKTRWGACRDERPGRFQLTRTR